MTIAAILRYGTVALASCALVPVALAQQDVQITNEAINRACADIHHTPNVQAEAPTVRGAQDIVLNCRLITTDGPTIAQLLPSEVCQRLTGSTEWYRGMGTQVYCRVTATTTPTQRTFTVTQEDIARACQRVHRNPQATADPTTVGRYGLELNCRLINQNGVVLARVSPEDVCYSKFGTREWIGIAGRTNFLCKGTPTDVGPPDILQNKQKNAEQGGNPPPVAGAFNDVPLTPEALTKGCKAIHGASATAGATTRTQTPGYTYRLDLVVNCNTDKGVIAHKLPEFCPTLSGRPEWYVTDFGRGTWMPGENVSAAPRIHVCRGPGALQYPALADIGRYCISKGHKYGNYGTTANRPPVCFDQPPASFTIAMADVCRDVHRARTAERRGLVYFCAPDGTPPPVADAGKAQQTQSGPVIAKPPGPKTEPPRQEAPTTTGPQPPTTTQTPTTTEPPSPPERDAKTIPRPASTSTFGVGTPAEHARLPEGKKRFEPPQDDDWDEIQTSLQQICPCLFIRLINTDELAKASGVPRGNIVIRHPDDLADVSDDIKGSINSPHLPADQPKAASGRKSWNFCNCWRNHKAGCNLVWSLATGQYPVLIWVVETEDGEGQQGNRHFAGNVGWNPGSRKGGKTERGAVRRRPPSVGLAHELAHAYHSSINQNENQKYSEKDRDTVAKYKTAEEARLAEEFAAVRAENQIRQELHDHPPRTRNSQWGAQTSPRTEYNLNGTPHPVTDYATGNLPIDDRFACDKK